MKRLISAMVATMLVVTTGVLGSAPTASALEAKPKVPAGYIVTPDGKMAKILKDSNSKRGEIPHTSVKGKPPTKKPTKTSGGISASALCSPNTCFEYNVGSQGSVSKHGVQVNMTVGGHQGALNGATDHHTLGEQAVRSADGQQIVEVGWTVDPKVNKVAGTNPPVGSYKPRPFVFSWVNGVPRGYNSAGDFVSISGCPVTFGVTDLTAGSVVQTKIWHDDTQNVWWISWDEVFCGYFPDSNWDNASPAVTNFDRVEWYQSFGEIASTEDTPCSDMGLGTLASSSSTTSTTARFSSTSYINGDWTLDTSTVNLSIYTTANAGSPYAAVYTPNTGNVRSFYYGGPMWNAAGTGVGVKGQPC